MFRCVKFVIMQPTVGNYHARIERLCHNFRFFTFVGVLFAEYSLKTYLKS